MVRWRLNSRDVSARCDMRMTQHPKPKAKKNIYIKPLQGFLGSCLALARRNPYPCFACNRVRDFEGPEHAAEQLDREPAFTPWLHTGPLRTTQLCQQRETLPAAG